MKNNDNILKRENLTFSSEQLKLARLASGMSLVDLGNTINVTRQYAHRLENGSRPSEEQIQKLASLLNVTENFFFKRRASPIEADECHFRSLRSSTQTMKKMVMAQVEIFETNFLKALNEEISFPEVNIMEIGDSDIASLSSIEVVAERFRRELGLGLGPISNVIKLAEKMGAFVLSLQGVDEKIDGFSMFKDRPIIVRNTAKQSPCRLRFDIAHEIGHLVMHQGVETGCRKTEEQANHFASALLIPRSSFQAEFPRMRGSSLNWDALEDMKVRWGVSLKAIIYRANKLGLITPEKAKSGFTYLVRQGYAKDERGDSRLTPEYPSLIQRAIDMLDKYSWMKLVKESGLNEMELRTTYQLKIPELHIKSV
jgi:Zn-dependent peptidase ImmA (M78 family)/DNA-binding XRE family transcriptional regulator